MILFRCPACGTAHRADPQYAGGMLPCRQCGKQVPIPHDSDPACALVYKAGEAEDGLPMTTEEIRLKLVSGELAETDLVWDSTTWKPLAQAYGGVREGEGLRLKRREEEPEAKQDQELQAPLVPLGAVQKVDLGELQAEQLSETKKKRFQLVRRHEAPEEKATPPATAGAAAPATPAAGGTTPAPAAGVQAVPVASPEGAAKARKPKGRLYYAVQVVLLVLALFFGFELGVGPLISQFRDKPTYVIVQNHEDVEYTALLGWRRSKEDLFKQSLVNYEIWVGIPERQTLRLVPKIPGTGQPFSLKVPVRPGGITLVNLKAAGEYGVYELGAVAGKKLESPELKALAAEIGSNRAPESAVKVSRQIRDLVAPTFKGTKQDMVFRSSQFTFDPAMLYRMKQRELDRQKAGKAKEKEKGKEKTGSPPPSTPKPLVCFPAARVVNFANGSALHSPADREKVDRAIVLPLSTLNLSASRIVKVPSPRLTFTGDAKALNLAIQMPNAKVSADGKTFTGTWEYRAWCALEGKEANRWRWSWVFRGLAESGGKRFSLELKVEADGKEARTVRPV